MAKKNTKQILTSVLKDIEPAEKKVRAEVNKVLKAINNEFKKQRIKAKVIAGGSIAKRTFLKDNHDCDVFALFQKTYCNKDLSGLLGKVLRNVFKKVKRLHGSRDYFQVKPKGSSFVYEIVPVIKITKAEQAFNITDCSPLHAQWVVQQLKKKPKLRKEIILLKAFCKSIGVYGAESYIRGFSGHVVDILTIYYGGFVKVLKASQKWKKGTNNTLREKTVVDFYNKHKGKAFFHLNTSKLQSALVVIDPTLDDRNAAAALQKEKLDLFKKQAKLFLKKPSEAFFVKQELSHKEAHQKAKAKKAHLVVIDVKAKKGKEDVVGAKLLKVFNFLKQNLAEHDFTVVDAAWVWGKKEKAVFYLMVKKQKLSELILIEGPPVDRKKHVLAFKKKHKKNFTKKKHKTKKWFAHEKRIYHDPAKLVVDVLEHAYVKERVKGIGVR